MSKYLAGLAGGTLGYISGNLPGAVIGAGLGYNSFPKKKQMNSHGRKRRNSGTGDIRNYFRSAKSRKGSLPRIPASVRRLIPYESKKKWLARSRRMLTRSKGGARHDDLGVVVSSKRSKGTRAKGTKRIKITSAFRKKVSQSLEGKKAIGNLTEIASMKFGNAIPDNLQSVGYFTDENVNGMFSPLRVLDAASVLFNRKALARIKTAATGVFPVTYTKINVIKQWVQFTLSNQTQRTKTITIYEANQKGVAAVPDHPLQCWVNALTLDDIDAPDADSAGPNLNAVVPSFLHAKPNQVKAFRKDYHVTSKTVLLEPGQVYNFSIQGDSGIYDFNKYHTGPTATLAENTNRTKWCFYTVHNDLIVTNAGVTGRFETTSTAIFRSIVCEYSYHYRIECPEQTGFKPGSTYASGAQTLNLIKDAYACINYSAGAGGGVINRIDDNDPTNPETGV